MKKNVGGIDLFDPRWSFGKFDAVYASNVIHIAAWPASERLFEHAAEHLNPGSILFLYGPFRYQD